jgi:hypothetical protein
MLKYSYLVLSAQFFILRVGGMLFLWIRYYVTFI